MKFTVIKKEKDFTSEITRKKLVDFLFTNLDRFGDPKKDIDNCIAYALSDAEGKGGFIVVGEDEGELVSAVIMNKTGMSGFIPEYVLVYVATLANKRGKGYGSKIINKVHEIAGTDVKLHVEYDNPAKRLYERLGYVNKYAEMRWSKER